MLVRPGEPPGPRHLIGGRAVEHVQLPSRQSPQPDGVSPVSKAAIPRHRVHRAVVADEGGAGGLNGTPPRWRTHRLRQVLHPPTGPHRPVPANHFVAVQIILCGVVPDSFAGPAIGLALASTALHSSLRQVNVTLAAKRLLPSCGSSLFSSLSRMNSAVPAHAAGHSVPSGR